MSGKWDPKQGSPAYEVTVKSMLIALNRANIYLINHPNLQGIFAGKKVLGPYGRKQVQSSRGGASSEVALCSSDESK